MRTSDRRPTGRPPHPDVLTPAEWRVLEQVRAGRSNPEIADVLGVSLNTVKTQVSSMLSKLGLRDRADLASWPGVPAEASRVALGRLHLAGPLAWIVERGGAWGGRIAVGAGLAAAGAVFLFAMQGMNDSGSPAGGAAGTSTPTPAATETVGAEPTPIGTEPTATSTVVPSPYLEVTRAAPLSLEAEFLVVVYGGVGNEAPPTHIERTVVEGGLILGREVVLDAAEIAGGGAYLNSWRNVHYPTRGTGESVVAVLCQGQCGGMGPASSDARTVLVRSLDRGRTWDPLATLDAAYWVWAWSHDGAEAILWRHPTPDDALGAVWEFYRWPSMVEITPPAASAAGAMEQRPPHLLADETLAWWATGGWSTRAVCCSSTSAISVSRSMRRRWSFSRRL